MRRPIRRYASAHALAAPYALDALDGAERAVFERHLRGCASCRSEVPGFTAVAAALAETAAVVPPAGLRDQVLGAVAAGGRLPGEAPARDGRPLAGEAPARAGRRGWRGGRREWRPERRLAPGLEPGPGRRPEPRPGRRPEPRSEQPPGRPEQRPAPGPAPRQVPRPVWLPRLASVAAAVGLAASVVLGYAAVSARNAQSAAQERARAIAAVLSAPDARLVTAPTSAGGTATAVVSVRQGRLVFTGSGLRPLPASRVYELWFIGATARPAGTLPAAPGGTPVLASGLAAGDRIGVTVEPAGGSSAPTTTPIVLLPLPA
ncbi:anti-sigma factor [Actinacidiphila epipremni]|uniref:Regulator of SigK n=1 Tax=Actinacidiphila epipremni TaxID=2053013 RepID=A0ABX0ZNQ5_9ACTN|nr:anti-sigma factor [Actinacidiphila epipremni]NJP43273.1 anti-sigma factor [Actinacidiphila epipremni]